MYQMLVKFSLCDKNKKQIWFSGNALCFGVMNKVPQEIRTKAKYIHYKPERQYDTPYDKVYWDLVTNLWFFPKMLNGQTLQDCNERGIYLDVTEWDAWHTYCCLCAMRYSNEHKGFAELLVEFSDKYGLSTFHTFLLLHIFNAVGDYSNYHHVPRLYWSFGHTLIAPIDCGILEMIKPDSFQDGVDFPVYGKPYVEWASYITLPNNKLIGIHNVFKEALIKYGGGHNIGRNGPTIEYPWGKSLSTLTWKNIDEALPYLFPSKQCLSNAA